MNGESAQAKILSQLVKIKIAITNQTNIIPAFSGINIKINQGYLNAFSYRKR